MSIPNFIDKTVITITKPISTTIKIPLRKKISPDLWNTFSNLNFAGVFRIGENCSGNRCYIDSGYNITLKVTTHINNLLRNDHYIQSLQEWFNNIGVENIDVSVLCWCPINPDIIEQKKEYYINKIKPIFNLPLVTKTKEQEEVNIERRSRRPTRIFIDMYTGEVTRTGGDKVKLIVKETVIRRTGIKFS